MPKVSIVIPHFNGRDLLDECLDSIYSSVYKDFEVLIVDNNSSDDSVEFLSKKYPQVKFLELKENKGFAGGCNVGIQASESPYILILNNDTIHDRNWIEPLATYLDGNPGYASVMPKILSYYDRKRFDYSGGSGGYLDTFGYPFVRGRLFEELEQDDGQYDSIDDIFWSSGTACLLRKEALNQVGLFDERFFAHMEEIDLHWRFHLGGWKVAVIPESKIYHKSGWTLPPDKYLKKYLNHRNNLIMMMANYSGKTLLKIIPIRLTLEYISAFYALVKLDYKRFFAVFASQIWIFLHLPYIINKHIKVKSLRKISDNDISKIMYGKSIVIQHYLKKKKTFSSL